MNGAERVGTALTSIFANSVSIARTALSRLGLHMEGSVPARFVSDFVTAIRPVDTEYELIRVGSPADGGYLIPNDLEGVKWLFSPGVSDNWSFEAALLEKGLVAFLCDGSITHTPTYDARLTFTRKNLGVTNCKSSMTLQSWLESSIGEANGDGILQMDIEGAEYECLLSTPSCILRRFRIIVIEFHALDLIASKLGYLLIARTFEHLAADFRIVHIHPNNCRKPVRVSGVEIHPVIEVTLLRQDRISTHSPSYREKHHLDADNVPSRPSVKLASSWHH